MTIKNPMKIETIVNPPGYVPDAHHAHFDALVLPKGIGDITSDARGSGARFNSGKPDLSLVPLKLLATTHLSDPHGAEELRCWGFALEYLGQYQGNHDVVNLYHALDELGDGWSECADVFTYGKKKYAAWNWAKGMPWSVPLACAARHIKHVLNGDHEMDLDPESGLPHRGHVFCNIVMLLQFAETYPEGNDLPPKGLL
jgi:hypothetical protein